MVLLNKLPKVKGIHQIINTFESKDGMIHLVMEHYTKSLLETITSVREKNDIFSEDDIIKIMK